MSVRLGAQWVGIGAPDMAVAQLAASLRALHWAGRRAGAEPPCGALGEGQPEGSLRKGRDAVITDNGWLRRGGSRGGVRGEADRLHLELEPGCRSGDQCLSEEGANS